MGSIRSGCQIRLWRGRLPECFVKVHLDDATRFRGTRRFDLRKRPRRKRMYEMLLRRGQPEELIDWIDGALLVDLWDELEIPQVVRQAWDPVVDLAGNGPIERPGTDRLPARPTLKPSQGREPGRRMSRGRRVAIRNLTEASLDDVPVNQLGLEERRNEGAVLLPKCAELCDAQVLLIQAPTGEDRLPSRRRRVGALHLDQSLAPALRYGRRLQVDTVNAETVELLERRELSSDAFDDVGEASRLVVVVGDRQYVDLERHRRLRRKLILGVGAEDRLRADDDHLRTPNDLAGRTDGVLKLVSSHQPTIASSSRTSRRSRLDSSPPIGETSRISIE